jgi:signal peptidase I
MSSGSIKFEHTRSNPEIARALHTSLAVEIIDYLWYFIKVFAIVLLTYLFLKDNVFRSFEVEGQSMKPSYNTGQKVYVNKIAPDVGDIRRGDVVVVHRPDEGCPASATHDTCFYIKRVIGLPGEKIRLEDGDVSIINKEYPRGVKLDESSYLSKEVKTYQKQVSGDGSAAFTTDEIPAGKYFLMGDNRPFSSDSRVFGNIEKNEIQGKEFFRQDRGFFVLPQYNIANTNK